MQTKGTGTNLGWTDRKTIDLADIQMRAHGTVFTDRPRPTHLMIPGTDLVGFAFNVQTLTLEAGTYLRPLYRRFGRQNRKGLLVAGSED